MIMTAEERRRVVESEVITMGEVRSLIRQLRGTRTNGPQDVIEEISDPADSAPSALKEALPSYCAICCREVLRTIVGKMKTLKVSANDLYEIDATELFLIFQAAIEAMGDPRR